MNNKEINKSNVSSTTPSVEKAASKVNTKTNEITVAPPAPDTSAINPQETIKNVKTTTDNLANNNAHIVISETDEVKGSVGTVIIGTISNGTSTPNNSALPLPIEVTEEKKVVKTKKGKKIRVLTKREKITNFLVTLFLLLLIAGGSYGTYYYLYVMNPSNFNVKNITIQLGEPIPQASSYYIDLDNISDPDYILNLSNVKEEIGTYDYTIKYKDVVKSGKINIVDTVGPVITPIENIRIPKNTKITKEMLVSSCEDVSNCTYEINKNIDTSIIQETTITILATDDLKNTSLTDIKVTITDEEKKLTCTKDNITSPEKYIYQEKNDMKFDADNKLVSNEITINGKFEYFNEFLDFTNKYTDDNSYVIDYVNSSFSHTYSVTTIGNDSLTTYQDIENYFTSNGYTCN